MSTNGDSSNAVDPSLQVTVECGGCETEWDITIEAMQTPIEIECPGCGRTWTSERD